jgi:D-alanine--poly(phosphoribitol) ligase subunit 1
MRGQIVPASSVQGALPSELWERWLEPLLEPNSSQSFIFPGLSVSVSATRVWSRARVVAQELAGAAGSEPAMLAIVGPKSPDLYVLMLACLRAGIPYVIVDHSMSKRRFERVFGTPPEVVVMAIGSEGHAFADRVHCTPLFFEADTFSGPLESLKQLRRSDPGNLLAKAAYGVMTSGSSGTPKVALIGHEALASFLGWVPNALALDRRNRVASVSPIHFDNFVFDFLGVLAAGASSICLDQSAFRNPHTMMASLRDSKCDYWYSTPSVLVYLDHLRLVSREEFGDIRTIAFGGEPMPTRTVAEFRKILDPDTRFINVYGPSECACMCSAHPLEPDDFYSGLPFPPLGRISSEFQYSIEAANLSDAEVGELILQGRQVGLGYWMAPETSAAHFASYRTKDGETGRAYRTGDMVFTDNKGLLHFHGRRDTQVKIRGVRIDLAEVEAVVLDIPGVHEVCATVIGTDPLLRQVGLHVSSSVSADVIRERCNEDLPAVMVPGEIRVWDSLPRNANGKVDRAILMGGPRDD